MAFVPIQYLQASTTSYTSSTATAITTDSTTTALLLSLLGASGNYTTVALTDGINYEIMFLTGVVAGAINVSRGEEGTTAVPLAQGASIRFIWTETSIQAIAPGGTVTCVGADATTVTGGPDYTISSPTYSVVAGSGISVSGGPIFTVSSTVPSGPSGPTGPAGPATVVTGTNLATATAITGGYNVDVASPVFVSGSGISVTGTWPNITITNTQTPGGTGTVTNLVAGTGIAISGATPTINPTISLTPTGVGAGTYGGVTLNASGQITAISSGFVTNISTSTTGITVSTPAVGTYEIDANSATTAAQGLVQLAPATSAGSNNPANSTQAVSPAGVSAVLSALTLNPASFAVAGTQSALSSASYTTIVSGFNIAINVASGKSALVDLYVEVYDASNPTVVQNFGVGLFNGTTLLAGVGNMPACHRSLKYLVTGPLTATLTVATTALTGTEAVTNYYASVVSN
jgi:hypothetical protein